MVPPDSGRVSRVRPYSGAHSGESVPFAYGAITLCGFRSSLIRLGTTLLTPAGVQNRRAWVPRHPVHNASGLACTRFRLCPLRSPLLRTSMSLSLPGVTKMFQFAPLASVDYEFIAGSRGIDPRGVPAFGDPRIKGCLTSPRLIAVDHVLRRLSAPRHPPHTLTSLTTEFGCPCPRSGLEYLYPNSGA